MRLFRRRSLLLVVWMVGVGGSSRPLPVAWFDRLSSTLTLVEVDVVWPEGLLDAYIAMIPKADGDSTPWVSGLCVLPVAYRLWASVRLQRLQEWFELWVPRSDVVKSFDTVDTGVLDYLLSWLGLPGWFRHAYFEYHA